MNRNVFYYWQRMFNEPESWNQAEEAEVLLLHPLTPFLCTWNDMQQIMNPSTSHTVHLSNGICVDAPSSSKENDLRRLLLLLKGAVS